MHKKIKLISKRNNVFRIVENDSTYILKKFKNQENYIKEIEILNVLKNAGVNVPSIIKSDENCIYLEDLGSVTLLDWYEEQEKQNKLDINMVYNLCRWLKVFYREVLELHKEQVILTDVNFRNFIINDNEIYGIDFEQVCEGIILEDVGKFSAYALTYEPVMTEWKINFRNKFIDIMSKELNIDKEKIILEEKKELLAMERRRGILFKDF
ncbi:RIO1 family regulatory kinase/ATPase domain-containing protein [Sedimentibacter sp. MB31-C6]|uniref:RIO1 family regulatory kinase/ATPase domain-containing protein n=1 Tax=Sedimentibacter sp. MB31-C6 TaxID=3109366 RepID=UPI002DDD5648|nr:RIO1 family regulatory kinase/ATPase [Sedimentibacter sp. MB36-C1]WSI02932.1 RIO1 family regulatory kinase/ATPase [Sedimentibacter sp. MB36-C1]